MTETPLTVFVIAGEDSGDQLGARLMEALRERAGDRIRFLGVGGERMEALGLVSLFPMHEIAHAGVTAIIANLHRILSRMRQAARAVVAARPDVLVIVDCPGFNLGVARRVRNRSPGIPIVQYVSPSVWVWRPGRARRTARFIDRILAILPFEPAIQERLGGPACTYVGHPLIQRLDRLRPAPGERTPIGEAGRPVFLVLPGSRRTEIKRLLKPFGETVAQVAKANGPMEIVLPAVPRLADEIRAAVASWPVRPEIVLGEEAKYAVFRRAHVALAASGTVTLELALSGVPMVVAYRVDPLVKPFKYALARINSFVLPNIITGSNEIPEFLDGDATPDRLAAALGRLFADTAERRAQEGAFARLDTLMAVDHGTPSGLAAEIVLETVRTGPPPRRRGRRNAAQRRFEIGT